MKQDGLEREWNLMLYKPVPVREFLKVPRQIGPEETVVADCRQTSLAESAVWDCHPPEVRLQDFARQQNYLDYSYLSQLQKQALPQL